MERLTQRDGVLIKANGGIENCIRKLAEYEDLGFTPEDIACLAKFYKDRTSVKAIENEMKAAAHLLRAVEFKQNVLDLISEYIVSVENNFPRMSTDGVKISILTDLYADVRDMEV